ncbi:DUF1330 domain-containing protein [Aureitalea sp. L0-47]|uniref:DUF1330 domain-containing protein n=1 Tax=Aureitalea sp. L0-47 TaxID=2816962 RepID=UPI0022388C5E|nr:DUF1330 domain-containing protein [Aureitalea sp. L0-47]MCW5519419.1 DUF1330 domain-containing protein [Aureitalea sp. L0-47]
MKYYSVLDVTPNSEEWIPKYIPTASKLVAKHGGTYLSRTLTHEQLEGTDAPVGVRVIIEWPSKEAATNFMNDPEYAPFLKMRTQGSESNHFLMLGQDDMAQ